MVTRAAIEVNGVRFSAGGTPILSDVSVEIPEGAYLSVLGPNGAGKTTLLKCVMGITRVQNGSISIFGKSLTDYRRRDLAKLISYVPQADARFFPFTTYEFVLLGRYPHLSPFTSVQACDREAVDSVMRLTGTSAFGPRLINTLSGGERQKVFIAAALAQGARILLLDEPTTFLDYGHQVEVLALLKRLNADEGITIVSVTHDVNQATAMSDAVLVLKSGRVMFQGTPESLLAGNVLGETYDTEFASAAVEGRRLPIILPKSAYR